MTFHTSSNGKLAVCTATERACPRGGAESHFDSIEDAAHHAIQMSLARERDTPTSDDKPEFLKAHEAAKATHKQALKDWPQEGEPGFDDGLDVVETASVAWADIVYKEALRRATDSPDLDDILDTEPFPLKEMIEEMIGSEAIVSWDHWEYIVSKKTDDDSELADRIWEASSR